MDRLPDNIKRIDVLRIERDMQKLCKCYEPRYELDVANRLVYCQTCRAIVDPFEALKNLAWNHEHLNNQVDSLLEQARDIQNYKPHLKVFKNLEQQYRANKFSMVPRCPHCASGFDFKDIDSWVNRNYCNWEVKVENDEPKSKTKN